MIIYNYLYILFTESLLDNGNTFYCFFIYLVLIGSVSMRYSTHNILFHSGIVLYVVCG